MPDDNPGTPPDTSAQVDTDTASIPKLSQELIDQLRAMLPPLTAEEITRLREQDAES